MGVHQDLELQTSPWSLPSVLSFLASSLHCHWLHNKSHHEADLMVEPELLFIHPTTHPADNICGSHWPSCGTYSFLIQSWETENHEVINIQTIREPLWNLRSTRISGTTNEEAEYPSKTKNLCMHAKQKKKSNNNCTFQCTTQAITPAAPGGSWQLDWTSV